MPTAKEHDLENLLNGKLVQLPNDAGVLAWDDVLLPLPQMNDDPVRKPLDKAVTAALDRTPSGSPRSARPSQGNPPSPTAPSGPTEAAINSRLDAKHLTAAYPHSTFVLSNSQPRGGPSSSQPAPFTCGPVL